MNRYSLGKWIHEHEGLCAALALILFVVLICTAAGPIDRHNRARLRWKVTSPVGEWVVWKVRELSTGNCVDLYLLDDTTVELCGSYAIERLADEGAP